MMIHNEGGEFTSPIKNKIRCYQKKLFKKILAASLPFAIACVGLIIGLYSHSTAFVIISILALLTYTVAEWDFIKELRNLRKK